MSAADKMAEALRQKLFAEVGKAMVEITTTVRGEDEWPAIPALWLDCMRERDEARAALAEWESGKAQPSVPDGWKLVAHLALDRAGYLVVVADDSPERPSLMPFPVYAGSPPNGAVPAMPTNEELERLSENHQGHPADFAADVLERWGGWQCGLLGYGGALNAAGSPFAGAVPTDWREFVERVSKQKPEKPDYWSSCCQCQNNSSEAEDLIDALLGQESQASHPTVQDGERG